jgi:hypothetical protein
LLDEPASLHVVVDIYMASKASWDPSQPIGGQFPELPAFEEFLALLHGE